MAPLGCTVRGRVWRGGVSQPDFEFDSISEYLAEPDTLVWVDLYDPDHAALTDLAERHPVVGEVRGEGVFWALELVADRDTRDPLRAGAGEFRWRISSSGRPCR